MLAIIGAAIVSCTPASKKARYAERGEHYFKAGEYDKAKIEYLNVLKIDQRDANAFARLGTMWLEEGAPLRAGGFLVKAIELAPNDADNHLQLARVYLAMGRAADARKEAATVLEKSPDKGMALLILVDSAQKPEDVTAAEQAVERFPNHADANYNLALAGIAAKKSDLAGAEAAVQRAEAASPNLPAVHSALANLYLFKKDLAQAGSEFEKAATLAAVRSTEKLKFAQFKVQNGATEEAKGYLKQLTSQAPDFLPAWSMQAKIANGEKKYDESMQLLQNVLSRDPDNVEARFLQVECWVAKGEKKKAVDSLENLDRAYPNAPVIKYALARTYLQTDNVNQAMGAVDQAVSLGPGFADAVLLQAQLRLKNGDAPGVVAPLTALLKTSPGLPQAELLLAEAYRTLGRFEDAAATIQEQIKRSPQSAAAYFLLGLVLKQQNKIEQARAAFEKAAELAPGNSSSVEQLVDLDIAAKGYQAGHARVNALLQKQPKSAAAYYMQGKLYVAEGKFDLAQSALLKAIDLDPNLTAAYQLLVPTFSRTNKPQDVLNEMTSILTRNPNDQRALLISGLIYSAMKDYNKARDSYEKLLTVNANSVPTLNNLAYIYAEKLNDLNRAAELAQKARSLVPSSAAVTDTLGWILYKQNNYQQAANLLAESSAKDPDNAEMQFHLGMADYMMGRTDAARAALQKAVASRQDFTGKEEARTRLSLLAASPAQGQSLSPAQLEQVLQRQPGDPVALMSLGETYEREGAAVKAADAYERALKSNPKLPAPAMKLAQLNAGPLKNPAKALDYAKKARELAPSDPHVAATLGGVAYQTGNFQWAYSLLQDAARQLGDDPEALDRFAWAAYSLGKVAEAQEAMQRIVDSSPSSPRASEARTFLTLVALDAEGKDPTASEGEVKRVLATDPHFVPALVAQGSIQQHRGDTKTAAALYTDILQQFPDFAVAQKHLAAIDAENPDTLGRASELANKARKNLPDDAELSCILGRISYKQKEYGRAIQLLRESERKRPLAPTSIFVLAMSQAQTGHKVEAREGLQRALDSGLGEPDATEAKRVLSELNRPMRE